MLRLDQRVSFRPSSVDYPITCRRYEGCHLAPAGRTWTVGPVAGAGQTDVDRTEAMGVQSVVGTVMAVTMVVAPAAVAVGNPSAVVGATLAVLVAATAGAPVPLAMPGSATVPTPPIRRPWVG